MRTNERPQPRLPIRVRALLTVSPSVPVRVSAKACALEISAPFGHLTVPYALITRVAKVDDRGIRLEVAGATMRLDFGGTPDMVVNALLNLMERDKRTGRS